MSFTIRQFASNDTLGDRLFLLRKTANRTLSELASETKIQKHLLEAFEKNDFYSLPEPIYARNILKTYVNALGGDPRYFCDRFESERGASDYLKHVRLPRQKARKIQFLVGQRIGKTAILISIFCAFLLYIGIQVRQIRIPPPLTISSPLDGSVSHEAYALIRGETLPNAHVTINGTPVLLEKNGSFQEQLPLRRGVNLLTIESSTRYGTPTIVYRRIVFE